MGKKYSTATSYAKKLMCTSSASLGKKLIVQMFDISISDLDDGSECTSPACRGQQNQEELLLRQVLVVPFHRSHWAGEMGKQEPHKFNKETCKVLPLRKNNPLDQDKLETKPGKQLCSTEPGVWLDKLPMTAPQAV